MRTQSKSKIAILSSIGIVGIIAALALVLTNQLSPTARSSQASFPPSTASTRDTPPASATPSPSSTSTVPALTPAFLKELAKNMQVAMTLATDNSNPPITQDAAATAALTDDPWQAKVTNASLVDATFPSSGASGMSLYWVLAVTPSVPVGVAHGPAPVVSTTTSVDTKPPPPPNIFAVVVDATTGKVLTRVAGYDPNYTP